jgi:Na+/proline symporter
VGAAGQVYESGLSGSRADPFGYALAMIVMALVLAIPLYRRKLTTIVDLFRQRFGTGVERVAVLVLVPGSVLWAAAQIRAFGMVLSATSTIEPVTAITIAAAVVMAYTASGGLLADAYTDFIQGIVLIVGLLVIAVALITSGDVAAIASAPPGHLRFTTEDRSIFDTLEAWSVPILGSLVAQELISRMLASRSETVARRSTLIASGMYLAIGIIPVAVGLAAVTVMPGIVDPEQVLILQAERYLPTVLYVVFAGALVSAILSTVDSALLVAGSLVAHNIVVPLYPEISQRARVRVNRLAVLAAGLVAYGLALTGQGVYELVQEAAAFGTSGALIALLFGLFSRFGGRASAYGALVTGVAVYSAGSHALGLRYPFLTSLASSLAVYVLLALTHPSERDDAQIGSREVGSGMAAPHDGERHS